MKKKPKLLLNRYTFDYEPGIKVAKAKYKNLEEFTKSCFMSDASLAALKDDWENAGDITVQEALSFKNLEARRIAFRYIGVENVFKALRPTLVDSQKISKETKVNAKGELEKFEDNYELYKVEGKVLLEDSDSTGGTREVRDFYILRCWCTSTGREYLIYVDDIWSGNGSTTRRGGRGGIRGTTTTPDAIEAVAWTIQVDIVAEDIDYIIRQGDCILTKTNKDAYKTCDMRHLSKNEYLEKVRFES